MTTIYDDFLGSSLDTVIWDETKSYSGAVSVSGGNLNCYGVSISSHAGIITASSYDISDHSIETSFEWTTSSSLSFGIALTSNTDEYLADQNDFYLWTYSSVDSKIRVQKRTAGGAVTTLYSADYASDTAIFKIFYDGTKIHFLVNDADVFSEAYDLSSPTVYIYLNSYSFVVPGTDYFYYFDMRPYPWTGPSLYQKRQIINELPAGTQSLGKVKITDDAENVIDSFGEETGISVARAITPIAANSTRSATGSTTLHTVTAGKTFYIISAFVSAATSTAGSANASIEIDIGGSYYAITQAHCISTSVGASYGGIGGNANQINPSVPIAVVAGKIIRLTATISSGSVYGGVIGWEE